MSMNRKITTFFLVILLFSCGGDNEQTNTVENTPTPEDIFESIYPTGKREKNETGEVIIVIGQVDGNNTSNRNRISEQRMMINKLVDAVKNGEVTTDFNTLGAHPFFSDDIWFNRKKIDQLSEHDIALYEEFIEKIKRIDDDLKLTGTVLLWMDLKPEWIPYKDELIMGSYFQPFASKEISLAGASISWNRNTGDLYISALNYYK